MAETMTNDTLQNRKRRLRRSQVLILLLILLLAFAGGVATYAWFTNNNKVDTNSVSVHSGDDALVVEMGDGSSWSTDETVSFYTDNSTDNMVLYPVSTYDLENFVECTGTNDDNQAVNFDEAEDGVTFYHGYVYIRARFTGGMEHAGTVALYLSDALKTSVDDSDLLKAARVGIRFSEAGSTRIIHYFPLDSTPGSHQSDHPVTAPVALPNYQQGDLLGWSGGRLSESADAAEDYTSYLVSGSSRPENALVNLNLDTTYRMDVYYYIEGTDADSANYLYKSGGTLMVNLYAALSSEGA